MINFCKQCNKEILNNKKFCSQECYFNFLKISENNPFYGKTHNKETKNKIKLFKIGKPGLKGKLNPNYKEGKYSDNPFKCIDCGNIITDKSKLGRCASCSKKGKLNHMYDKKQSLESNIKRSQKLKGRIFTKEHKSKIGLRNKNKVVTNSTKMKMSIARVNKSLIEFNHKLESCLCFICKAKRGETSGKNANNWQGGKSFEPYPLGWTKTFKEQIRYRDNYKCRFCGVPEIECKTKLHVHHIDYNKFNLNINNLISLCCKCHGKTNYNKEYWIKYFSTKDSLEEEFSLSSRRGLS